MKNRSDPFDLLFSFLIKLNNPVLETLVKSEIMKNWGIVEDYLTHPRKVYDFLWQNPELRHVLKKKETIEWLNWACERAYKKILPLAKEQIIKAQ